MKIFKLLFLLIPLFFLFGCSIPTHIYIQNPKSKDCLFSIKFKIPIKNLPSYRTTQYPYVSEIITPKKFIKLKNLDYLEFKELNDSTIALNISKESTVRIERVSNTRYYDYIESFELNGKTVTLEEFASNSKRKGPHLLFEINE